MFTSANKLMAVCLVAVFSMVMYGCSSSSKKATMTDPLITMPGSGAGTDACRATGSG